MKKNISPIEKIENYLNNNKIVLYMKGNPKSPSCGFSAQAVKILSFFKVDVCYVDVLQNADIRLHLPNYANWPTFPQLWIKKKLIGGCDVMMEMFKNGQLKKIIDTLKV